MVANTDPSARTRRNLRAFFFLGFVLSLLASIGGALILARWYRVPNATEPLWQFGQWMMLFGLCTLFVQVGLVFQVRRLLKHKED